MKLIFFDEVKPDEDHPHYHLGGICVDESDLLEIEGLVGNLSQSIFGDRTLRRDTEFHAADIYHRKNTFKDWKDVGARHDILGGIIDILSLDSVMLWLHEVRAGVAGWDTDYFQHFRKPN